MERRRSARLSVEADARKPSKRPRKPRATLGQVLGELWALTPFPAIVRGWVGAEIIVLRLIQRIRRWLPLRLRQFINSFVSSHPLHDISCAVWLAAFVGIWFVGWELTWMMTANVALSFILSWIFRFSSPSDVDPSIRSRGRVSPCGFPCVELHLLTVFASTIIIASGRHPVAMGVGVGSIVGLFLLRVYALTHFITQLLGA